MHLVRYDGLSSAPFQEHSSQAALAVELQERISNSLSPHSEHCSHLERTPSFAEKVSAGQGRQAGDPERAQSASLKNPGGQLGQLRATEMLDETIT